MQVAAPTRAEQLAVVRKVLSAAFPTAEITTNDDANPATPFVVKLSWNSGRIIKTVRADSPSATPEQFLSKAQPLLERFQIENVPARHKQVE